MNKDLRWRIITLQIILVVLFGFGGGLALSLGNFTHDQITSQLAPQQISFPADVKSGLPADLQQYAGQQVLTGDQAHAYADQFIALHLSEMGDPKGMPYSYWSAQARTETDPTKAAADNALVDTIFRGDTLRSMLDQTWAFWTVGNYMIYAGFGLLVAAVVVAGALAFELFYAPKRATQTVKASSLATSAS